MFGNAFSGVHPKINGPLFISMSISMHVVICFPVFFFVALGLALASWRDLGTSGFSTGLNPSNNSSGRNCTNLTSLNNESGASINYPFSLWNATMMTTTHNDTTTTTNIRDSGGNTSLCFAESSFFHGAATCESERRSLVVSIQVGSGWFLLALGLEVPILIYAAYYFWRYKSSVTWISRLGVVIPTETVIAFYFYICFIVGWSCIFRSYDALQQLDVVSRDCAIEMTGRAVRPLPRIYGVVPLDIAYQVLMPTSTAFFLPSLVVAYLWFRWRRQQLAIAAAAGATTGSSPVEDTDDEAVAPAGEDDASAMVRIRTIADASSPARAASIRDKAEVTDEHSSHLLAPTKHEV